MNAMMLLFVADGRASYSLWVPTHTLDEGRAALAAACAALAAALAAVAALFAVSARV